MKAVLVFVLSFVTSSKACSAGGPRPIVSPHHTPKCLGAFTRSSESNVKCNKYEPVLKPRLPPPSGDILLYDIYEIVVLENTDPEKKEGQLVEEILQEWTNVLKIHGHHLRWKRTAKREYSERIYFRLRVRKGQRFDGVRGSKYNVVSNRKSATTCKRVKTTFAQEAVTWEEMDVGTLSYFVLGDKVLIRECHWDAKSEVAKWSTTSTWTAHWLAKCNRTRENRDVDTYADDMIVILQLQLNTRVAVADNVTSLVDTGDILYRLWWRIRRNGHNEAQYFVKHRIWKTLEEINTRIVFKPNTDFLTYGDGYSSIFLISNLTSNSKPVIGVNSVYDQVFHTQSTFHASRQSECGRKNSTQIGLTVSDDLAKNHDRLAISLFLDKGGLPDFAPHGHFDRRVFSYIAQVVLTKVGSKVNHSLILADGFVEIIVRNDLRVGHVKEHCVSIGSTDGEWSEANCEVTNSECGTVCRCSNLYHDKVSTRGYFAIYFTNVTFTTHLTGNVPLSSFLIADVVLFLFGFLSVVMAATTVRKWTNKNSHNLNLTVAMSANIFLTFGNNLLKIDDYRQPCLFLGALRHVTYVAMFSWTFLLILNKLNRVNKEMEKNKTVSPFVVIFTWTTSALPAIRLWYLNPNHYVSVFVNRGYCYPDGKNFFKIVQGPPALILIFILGLCLKLFKHYYWGKDNGMRSKNKTDKTVLLKTVLSSFLKFLGLLITWLVHCLSMGLVNKGYDYEVMYLMTLGFLVFLLSWEGVGGKQWAKWVCTVGVEEVSSRANIQAKKKD